MSASKVESILGAPEEMRFRERQDVLIKEGGIDQALKMGIDHFLEKFPNGRYDQNLLEMISDLRKNNDLHN
jgi:hypothetical protein